MNITKCSIRGSVLRDYTAFSSRFPPPSTSRVWVCLPGPSSRDDAACRRWPDVPSPAKAAADGRARVDEVLADVTDPSAAWRRQNGGTQSSVEVVVELGVWRRAGARTAVIVIIPVCASRLRVLRHHLHSPEQRTQSSTECLHHRQQNIYSSRWFIGQFLHRGQWPTETVYGKMASVSGKPRPWNSHGPITDRSFITWLCLELIMFHKL